MGKVFNSTLTRRTPLRAKTAWKKGGKVQPLPSGLVGTLLKKPKPRKPMKRAGKKVKEWDACRARMKPRFERAGITICEAQLTGCWRNNALSFAHAKKRRNIAPGELDEAILCCVPCHNIIEAWAEIRMTEFVRRIIADRGTQVERESSI